MNLVYDESNPRLKHSKIIPGFIYEGYIDFKMEMVCSKAKKFILSHLAFSRQSQMKFRMRIEGGVFGSLSTSPRDQLPRYDQGRVLHTDSLSLSWYSEITENLPVRN